VLVLHQACNSFINILEHVVIQVREQEFTRGRVFIDVENALVVDLKAVFEL
jgi:hypothetical protein